jgi:starch phosphorylase
MEALALYDLLEKEVVPLYYDRNTEGLPRAWIDRVKTSMKRLCPVYNTHRMVSQYAETFYFPMAERHRRLAQNGLAQTKALVTWKQRMGEGWHDVCVDRVETDDPEETAPVETGDTASALCVGDSLHVTAYVRLGAIEPSDVVVEAMYGVLDSNRQITEPVAQPLTWKSVERGLNRYEGSVPCSRSGLQGFAVRVRPTHPDAVLPQELALIAWE